MSSNKAVPDAESVQEKPAAKRTVTRKKTAAKKEKPAREEKVVLQVAKKEWDISDCKARVIAAYIALGHRERSIKKMDIYLKPEEGKAYYVINNNLNGSIDL